MHFAWRFARRCGRLDDLGVIVQTVSTKNANLSVLINTDKREAQLLITHEREALKFLLTEEEAEDVAKALIRTVAHIRGQDQYVLCFKGEKK